MIEGNCLFIQFLSFIFIQRTVYLFEMSPGSAPHAVYEELADLPGITQEIKGVLKGDP